MTETSETPQTPQAPLPHPSWYADMSLPNHLHYPDGRRSGQPWNAESTGETLHPRFERTARLVRLGLRLTLAVLAAGFAVQVWGVTMVRAAFERGDIDQLSTYDTLNAATTMATLALSALTGVGWLVWQYRLARSAKPGELDRSPGMHAGSWLIPFANLVLPLRNLRDLWRVFLPRRERGVLGFWWACWILRPLILLSVNGQLDSAANAGDFQFVMATAAFGALCGIVAAVLALRIVGALTTAAVERSAAGLVPHAV